MVVKGKFNVPIYNCEVHVIVSDNLLASINYRLRVNGDGKLKDEPGAYFYNHDACNYYVFFKKETLDINYLNHEKSHLVEQILKDRGIRAMDEVRSYLDGFVSEKLNEFLKKRKIKLK